MAAVIPAMVMTGVVAAQGGDQFLDGIGETAIVARYLFNGNAEDSSRNHLHAALIGSGAAYVGDARFGRALELAGNGGHARLPGNALAGEDTISVTGWLYLPTGASGPFFDFGQSAASEPGYSRQQLTPVVSWTGQLKRIARSKSRATGLDPHRPLSSFRRSGAH